MASTGSPSRSAVTPSKTSGGKPSGQTTSGNGKSKPKSGRK